MPETLALFGGSPVRKTPLIFGRPDIGMHEFMALGKLFMRRWLSTGPVVKEFEEAMMQYTHMPYACAVSSCTAALELSMMALDVKPGDEVITTPMTFFATVGSIVTVGATPILADCERDSMNINPEEVKKKITERTKGIIPVHFAGRPCDMKSLEEIAKENNIWLLSDAAHAIETQSSDRHIANYGTATAFSFYATKNITCGEGGMVLSHDGRLIDRIKVLSNHGLSNDAFMRYSATGFGHALAQEFGRKANLSDIHAAIGVAQLPKIEKFWVKRDAIWREYDSQLSSLPLELPAPEDPNEIHARHLYTVLLKLKGLRATRDEIVQAIKREGIGVGVHYDAIHKHPAFIQKFGILEGTLPNAEYISERTLSLPITPDMTHADSNDVIKAMHKVLTYFAK